MSTVKDVSEFYGKLQGSNAFIGLPEKQEFVQMFDNTQARRGLYEQLRNSGRINGLPDTFEEFSLAFGYNASGDSRLEQKRHNREVAEDNLRVLREDGLIEEAKGIKKDAAKSKRQARRRSIAEYITSPKMTGTATGVAQPIGQQIAEQNVENALQNEEYRESAELYGEERLLHRTMRDALRDAKNVERGVIGQGAAPLVQKLFNVSTWDMGVSEGLDNLTLSALLEKADDGTITESEEMLLDTLALANVIQQNADAAKSGVTKVAEAIPQSFAFMAQMAANPATGFTRSIAKRAVKKYGVDAMEMGAKELMRNYGGKALARKVGAGLAASIPETAAFATTVGAARSMADAERRAQGNIQTYVDDNGYIQYAGHTEGEDLPTALLKSFGSTFIEGWSEMLGTAAFDPMLSLLKGVKSGKMMSSLADLKKGLNAIKGSEWSVAIKNFKQNAHWDGIINEMLEEEVGMVMSGLFNIENTLNRYNEDGTINENWILDGGNQLRTLLTIAITEGTFKAVEYVGNISELRKMENNLKIAESDGAKIVGARWGEIQKEIDELDPDGVADYIMSLASDPAITNEMLAAATNYATTLVRWQQYNLATDTQEYDDMSEVMRNAMAAYRAGRQMHIANFRSVQQRADKAYDALAQRDADLLKRADEWLEQQKQTGKLPTTEIETIRNGLSADMSTLLDEYIGAMTARQGIYDKIDDTAYSQMDVFERDLAPVIRDGAVTTATLDGKPVYVLSQENGSAVILSEDAETEHKGKGMMVDASRLKDISTIDAKQLVDAYRYRYATDEQTKADMALNHHRNTQMPTVGMQIDTPSAVEGGATTFIVTNVQPQMGYVELVPGEYDAEQGKVVPKDGAEPIYQTVYSTLQMQDEMYDALDAMNGTQSVPTEGAITEGNEQTEEEAPVVVPTEEEVTPTEEEVATQEEEVATEETTPAERSQAEIDADDAAELAELGDNDYISSNLDKAKKILDKAKKKKPKATEKEARLAEARTIKAEVDAAQAEVDRWTAASQEVARRALQATQTEQAPTGEATGVGENIQSSWAEAEKIEGNTGSKTLQDGTVIKGRYMLVPASAPTASHDALNGYAPSAGFPTNERGQNINDRDYQNDKAAQTETDRIARVYGGQAVSDTPVVSPEGIVYSGNGRTMASQLAAANGTDSAYMEALRSNAAQFGFTPEQVDSTPNARVVFVTDEVLPYTTETFAKFNQQEKKTQSSTERAVSKSKSLKDKSIARILSIIDSYDTLQSFFNSPKACADMLSVLQQDGVITEAEVAGLTELNSNNETILSATGRDLVTDVVLGATFSEQTLRQMGGDKALKQSVLRALPSIIENRQLKEYALNNELEKAISLLYEARKAKMSLEQFLQTTDMFNGSPTDRYSAFDILVAEQLNEGIEAFREVISLYNNSASTLVGGQAELFGEALTKEDIQNLILEKYGRTNNRGKENESVSESNSREKQAETAAERRKKYGITAKEDARREPLRERAREVAEKLGTNINVIEDKSEVTNEDAKKQMRQHKNSIVKGWFENSTGELFIVLPSMDDMADLEATILHELVAHKGLRNLLGARKFNQLCDAVWEMMTPEQQQEWLAYPGVNGNKRAAADEYIASLAEKMDLSEVEQTTWNKIKQFVLDVLQKLGFRDITENDVQDLIRASYAYMRAGNTNEQTTNEGNRYKVYRSRDGKEVGYTQLSQLSLQFDWGERERDTVSGRNTDVLQREDDATLATLNTNRQLEEGEVCNVERIFTESKGFDFTSGEKIESAADVAYIFKNLEDEAIENVFVALVKDGKPTVIHVGMGGQTYSLADNSAIVAAANRINPDKVYVVHNHPSGALRCSPQDRMILKSIKDALGDVVQDGIIINTRSGKFGVFSESMFGTDGTSDMPENKEDSPLKVYKFNKQAFKSNVITVEASPNGIAEFISTQRLGTRNKINALLLNNQYGCVGNVFLTETEVNDANRDSIAQRLVDDAVAMNAKNIVIYGNYPLVSVAVESNIQLREAIEKASGNTVELKDVIEINGSAFPPSALNYGVRFRTTIAPEVREEMESIKADAIANGTFLKAPNGKDTNLNEEQWLMVRTNNFKKWFGDWMKAARIEKLRKSKNASIKGDEIVITDNDKQNKKNAIEYGKTIKDEYINADTGKSVLLNSSKKNGGLYEILQHDYKDKEHLLSIAAIPQIIEKSIYIDTVKNEDKDNHPQVLSYDYFLCGLNIGNEEYTVKAVLSNLEDGSRYYDHKLTSIEKGRLIDIINEAPVSSVSISTQTPESSAYSDIKDKRLFSILQTNSSKIVDENGEPMVVYHGTDSEFTSFEMQDGSIGRGAYFTSNWDEAAQYAMEKQGVENIDELDESKIKEVFLNVRDEKNITHSRFSRGDIEVLATSPNQIKSATDNNGEFGESNDISFRIVNDLMAVHNLTEDKLRKVFDMGGLIMPSIAITKADMGHEGYGEISLLFDKDTIDPSDRRNKVFGGDAWTPRIPQLMPKLNEKVSARVKSKIRELIDNRALAEIYSLSAELHQDNIERTISERGVKGYYSEEWMKYAYLLDNGKKVKIPMIEKDYGTHSEMILELLKEKGLKASEINKDTYDFYKNNPDVVEDIKNRINEKKANSVSEDQREAVLKLLNERGMSFNFFSSLIRSAAGLEYDLENGGKKQIIDRGALRETINKKVKTDNADYNKWVDNLFEGIVEKYGIRNKTDWYTPSGNLRSWEKLYDAATPANILRHMLAENEQGGSGGFWDSNIMGASADTYESIEEIREKGQKRLRRVDSNEYDEWATSVANRFSEISDEFLTPAQRNNFGGIIDAKIAITNAVAKDKTAKGIYKEMKADYPNFTMDHANRVVEIVREIQDYAIGYFEAKPQRIVPLSEVRKAIVPSNTSEDIVKELKDNGIEVATYRKGNEASRQRLIKKESNGIRFRVANENQEIFVSNAQRAVESIKQDKATPEQWLAMITKQGGLKAGEDKWLGLSDWLKSSDAKTVTKQEILDFIAENKIQIEEVKYGDANNADGFVSLKEEYVQWLREEGSDYAWGQLIERYGDDAEIAFNDLGGELVVENEERAAALLEGGNIINSTRLDYTTAGLDNNREIALTVPTIESWNQGDEVHFGDAGDGRAIAWVRFGDTSYYENVEDVQEVTEFHEPYKNANGRDVYKPVGGFRSGDYIVNGQAKAGDMIYVVYINDRQIPVAHSTLEEARDAMNEYYKEHPRKLRKTNRVLVIDEIQSKRHQEGREKGYFDIKYYRRREDELNDKLDSVVEKRMKLIESLRNKYPNGYMKTIDWVDDNGMMQRKMVVDESKVTEEEYNLYNEYSKQLIDLHDSLHELAKSINSEIVPDTPFDKNWHELAMKRMLRLAAEEGYDYVAWTTGAQQAKRYDIGSAIDHVDASPSDIGVDVELVTNGGGYITLAVEENGTIRTGGYANENFAGKQLSEVVGKELAVRILSTTEDNTRYEGEDLVIGGEGMKGFYDKMLPSFVSKYTKKWGAKVEDIELPQLEESARVMHSVNITPEMKESVMQGQTMFRIKEVNDKFNSELKTLNEENADRVVLNVGNPSPVLLSAGVEDRPMKLYGNKIIKKVKKHGLKIQDLKNLPSAVADPIAVFDNYKQEGNRSILTELRVADGNILATIDLGKGMDVDFNIVSSTFGKSDNKIVAWINKGFATYINKEKALDYLHLSAPIAEASDKKELSSATNIVEMFENPTIESENSEVSEDRTMFSVKQRTEADYQDIENRLGIAAAEYERRMDMVSVHHMEAWQDSMRSLLEMQRAIEKETGKPILDYENAYMAENRMSSENFAQKEEWKRKFFRPLEDIYKGFIDRGENQFSIRDYLFAKHGMERNAVMARREAQRLYPNDPLQQIAKESDLKRTKDYSGLKKLMGKDNIPDAIAEAQKYVQDFEKKHKAEIAKLWDAIRNATHSQLEVQRASGLLTQEKYEEIKNMYNYYVPLRGFSETTTDEVYDYLDNAPTPYNVPIKTAKGRESVGDDPIANIANMAESGIMQANRNKMKLHFLNMTERHKTNLVTVSEVIYKYNPITKMWEPTLPALSPNDTIEETLAKIRQHRVNVANEMILNPQDYKTEANLKKMGRDIPYKVINKAMLSEHQVLVMREGKQMVMTINGNPRAAQALNGLTNPEVKAEEQRWIQKANRFMAANFTSRNPAFVISNLSRDSIYAVSMVWAKEAPKYARAFMNNMGKVFANMASLMRKYNNGTLDTNVPMEKMFLEFVMNGGQTGYTHLNSVEDYKRQMAKEMKRAAQHKGVRAVTETGRAILNGLESMNKWAENISRFTAYVTSREEGRSISRSISDAKEISVNFNKKGAGNSVAGKFEKGNRLNYLSSQAAQLARGLYIFMNAGIQGMANFAKQAKRHPYKITAMIASSMALGLAAALLSGGGDDEEEYLSLPKYTRRNNLCIKVGDKFVTIPLPIELRAFYGIGELIASRTALGEYYSDAEFAKEFAEQLSQLLPIDVLEGGEGFNIKSFIPSAAKPIVDVILNESWTGIPIYNDSEFVKTYPGWKKAYKGTNDMLVDVSRWLNEHSGGSDYRQGVIDINPAAIEYIAEQYFGGVGTTVNQFFKMGQTATGAMEFEWRNVPVASRFVNSGNETTQIRAIRNSYYDYREEMDAVGKEFNAYMRDLKEPDLSEKEYQRIEREIDRIVNSPEYDFYLWWKDINKVINRAKDAGDTEGADELMREAVETYRSWKKGLKE